MFSFSNIHSGLFYSLFASDILKSTEFYKASWSGERTGSRQGEKSKGSAHLWFLNVNVLWNASVLWAPTRKWTRRGWGCILSFCWAAGGWLSKASMLAGAFELCQFPGWVAAAAMSLGCTGRVCCSQQLPDASAPPDAREGSPSLLLLPSSRTAWRHRAFFHLFVPSWKAWGARWTE